MAEPAPTTVFLTLGSNIEPWSNLARAVRRLRAEVEVEAVSGVWESEPYGAPGTPRFLNAAARIRTALDPGELKRLLRRVETDLGRRRDGHRNAPRTIDLDIALFGSLVIDDPAAGLRIPDPEIAQRGYLALPLAEVGGSVVHPQSGRRLAEIAAALAGGDEPRRVAVSLESGAAGGA